jgi:pyruvate dehydrogenase E1 component
VTSRDDVGPILNGIPTHLPDIDPAETQEWLDSLDAVIDGPGRMRARYLMLRLLERARAMQVGVPSLTTTDYVNTIPRAGTLVPRRRGRRAPLPRLPALERRDDRAPRAAPRHRRRRPHLPTRRRPRSTRWASTTSSAARTTPAAATRSSSRATPPPACTPAPSSRAASHRDRLDGFRQEKSHVVDGSPLALPSYPHPRLMPDFWEFPTVSMGLGPMNAIYQAQFNKYLHNRGIKDTSQQQVWAFLGDGEMDEPESRGLLQLAAGEELDNLNFVVNCNLQRLDGPVRGNGKIIQELEAFFRGAGWNVIKVVWGRGWDPLLAADGDGALVPPDELDL